MDNKSLIRCVRLLIKISKFLIYVLILMSFYFIVFSSNKFEAFVILIFVLLINIILDYIENFDLFNWF